MNTPLLIIVLAIGFTQINGFNLDPTLSASSEHKLQSVDEYFLGELRCYNTSTYIVDSKYATSLATNFDHMIGISNCVVYATDQFLDQFNVEPIDELLVQYCSLPTYLLYKSEKIPSYAITIEPDCRAKFPTELLMDIYHYNYASTTEKIDDATMFFAKYAGDINKTFKAFSVFVDCMKNFILTKGVLNDESCYQYAKQASIETTSFIKNLISH